MLVSCRPSCTCLWIDVRPDSACINANVHAHLAMLGADDVYSESMVGLPAGSTLALRTSWRWMC